VLETLEYRSWKVIESSRTRAYITISNTDF
jgi:hypothetical protein